MGQVTFTVGIPAELEERLMSEVRRLGTTRNGFVRRALEAALPEAPTGSPLTKPTASESASPRTSVPHMEGEGRIEQKWSAEEIERASRPVVSPRKPRPKGIA